MQYHAIPVALLAVGTLAGQEARRQYSTYTYDVNGRRVAASALGTSAGAAGGFRSETAQSINGRRVPLETVEEKVLREGAGGRVLERTVTRYDQTGRAAGVERILVEEKALGAGRTLVSTTVQERDLNGNFRLRERSVTERSKQGEVERSETRVERPTINGALEVEELRVEVATGGETQQHVDLTLLRREASGGFREAAREVSETRVSEQGTTTSSTVYNTAVTGRMEVAGRTVTRVTTRPDGGQVQVVDVYGRAAPGRTMEGGRAELELREQQVIERKAGADQSYSETFSVRRANLESGRLGALEKVSETSCSGECVPAANR